MKPQLLTIAIPTYNRPEQLQNTLRVILPQIVSDERVRLMVLDNHSAVPAQQVYNALDIKVDVERVEIIRNKVNIGASANVMRCFEMCETAWLWVLGDDDSPAPDAVEIILRDTHINHCFAFYTVPRIKKPMFKEGAPLNVCGTDFRELVSYFGRSKLEISFLSAAVFQMEKIRPHIISGYLSANTGLPHLMMVFKALSEGSHWMLSRDVIADYCPPEKSQGWGFMTFVFAMPSLFGLASSGEEVRIIKEIFIKGWRPSPKKILYTLVRKYMGKSCGGRDIYHLFGIIKDSYAPAWREDTTLKFRWCISSVWALFPRTFAKSYEMKKQGRARINLDNEDRR